MNPNKTKKPKWLRRLEKESWQAELVISGIAIFGSLQLPDLLDELAESVYGTFSHSSDLAIYFFFIYSFFAIYLLIGSFIIHFILRALWVGMVGLNSVFPEGINVEKSKFSKHFTQRLKEEVEYSSDIIQDLDDLCSLVFSMAANTVMIFVAISLDVLILFGIWSIIGNLFSPEIATIVIKSLLGLLIIVFIISFLFNLKKVRDTDFAKKWHFPFFQWSSKIFLHIFYRPIQVLGYTFTTNLELKKYYTWSFVGMAFIMMLSMNKLIHSSALLFSRSDVMEIFYNRSDRMYAENYDNLRNGNHGRILSAVIESDRISGPSMRVFVPVFNNESVWQEDVCGEYEKDENISKRENKELKRVFYKDCLKKYHRFYVNDKIYELNIQKFEHDNKKEDGILVYFPTDDFIIGENLLKIEKWSSDTIMRTMKVPFRFEPKWTNNQ